MQTLSEDWSVYHASQTYCICVVRNWASVEERVSRNRLKRRHLLQQMQTEVSNSVVQLLCHLQAFWNYYNTESVPKACLVCLLLQNYFSYNIYIDLIYTSIYYIFLNNLLQVSSWVIGKLIVSYPVTLLSHPWWQLLFKKSICSNNKNS